VIKNTNAINKKLPITITAIALISTMIFLNPIFATVYARNMGANQCVKLDNGTIGQVYCCAKDLDTSKVWCTTCDATNPPSNCGPAKQVDRENGDTANPKDNGGVLSNNDDSGNSGIPKGIDPSTGGTFNEDSESSNSGIPKGIDPSNSGGVFSQ
jgi:hypothetical protein